MKKIIISLIVGLFLINASSAQSVTLPTFTGKNVVVKMQEKSNSQGWFYATDGIIDTYKLQLIGKAKDEIDYAKIIATTINQLADQGYKLTNTNGSSQAFSEPTYSLTYYIFQKE